MKIIAEYNNAGRLYREEADINPTEVNEDIVVKQLKVDIVSKVISDILTMFISTLGLNEMNTISLSLGLTITNMFVDEEIKITKI